VYDDVELPFPDAKVASLLCVGGPCSYRVKEGANNVNDNWIRTHVVPETTIVYDAELSLILGKAILWLSFSELNARVPVNIRNRIHQQYGMIRQLDDGVNPVEKCLLLVTGFDAVVQINEVRVPAVDNVGQQQAVAAAGNDLETQNIEGMSSRQIMLGMLAQITVLQRGIVNLNREHENDRATLSRQIRVLNQNIRRVAINPIRWLNQQQ